MPTVQGTDDFNHAFDSGYYTDGFYGTPTSETSPLYASQARTLKLLTDGGTLGVRHAITGSSTRGWAAFPFRTPALPGSGAYSVANFGTISGSTGALYLGTSGLFIANSDNNGAETAISANTWYWVEMIFDVSSGSHNIYGRIEGVDMASPAGHTEAATVIEHNQLLNFGDAAGQTLLFGMWKWGTASSVSDWLGEPATVTLDNCLPDADIVTTGWSTAPLFSKVNDASDATVITATAS